MKKQVACFRFFCYIMSIIQMLFVHLYSGHSPRFSQSYENVISCQDSGDRKTYGAAICKPAIETAGKTFAGQTAA